MDTGCFVVPVAGAGVYPGLVGPAYYFSFLQFLSFILIKE